MKPSPDPLQAHLAANGSEMVERMARAIYESYSWPEATWDEQTKARWMRHARAAIETMRNPPARLQREAWHSANEDPEYWWNAMIDEALK